MGLRMDPTRGCLARVQPGLQYDAYDLEKALKWAHAITESTEEPVLALGVYPVWVNKSAYQIMYDWSTPYIHAIIRVQTFYFDF